MRRLCLLLVAALALLLPAAAHAEAPQSQRRVVLTGAVVLLTALGHASFVDNQTLTLRAIDYETNTTTDLDTAVSGASGEPGVFTLTVAPCAGPCWYYVTPNADRPDDPTAPCDDSAPFQLAGGVEVLILCHR